ncbi:MAG: Xaa-Pro peptidase family protein [Treponema sp.]|nr:Xaa-Pro peptidase family protein [Treponema sp.]
MDASLYRDRIQRVRAAMDRDDIDLFLLGPSPDLFYLIGYGGRPDERLLALVLPRTGEPFLIANLLYQAQLEALPLEGPPLLWKDGEDPFALLKTQIAHRSLAHKRWAVNEGLPALFTVPLGALFKGDEFTLGSSIMKAQRQYKDPVELDKIRRACRASDEALGRLIQQGDYWLGKTERDFSEALASELGRLGLEQYGASVAVGPNAAIPHHHTGTAPIQRGACLLVDFWASLEGYFSDCTRTFHFGEPEEDFKTIHALVLQAQEAAQMAAVPGSTLSDIDGAARSVIEEAGYGEYFTHRTGHGLGLEVHEGDSVNRGVRTPLAPGMVFSIEPGIYLPGRFGVRIENLVAATEGPPEIFHHYPRELMIL